MDDEFKIGDTLVIQPFQGGTKTIEVKKMEADLFPDRTTFEGLTVDGEKVFGYGHQIRDIIKR